MAETTAQLKNYRQSPRKVRLVADLIRGKSVDRSLALLATLPKRAAGPVGKLLHSALANASAKGASANDLYVSRIEVNQGIVFRRMRARARGRGAPIRKKTSHITLALDRKGKGAKKAPATPAKEKAATQ